MRLSVCATIIHYDNVGSSALPLTTHDHCFDIPQAKIATVSGLGENNDARMRALFLSTGAW
jgi:hypothetical protein